MTRWALGRAVIRRVESLWWGPGGPTRPPLWAWPLGILERAYRLGLDCKRRFDLRRARHSAPARVPVIVVGNWVVGGAGKTPVTRALVDHLRQRGWNPGIVSRGYGRASNAPPLVIAAHHEAWSVGDEPLLLARMTGVPVAVGRDRCAARDLLLQSHPEVNLIIADDGLQHWRLRRDLDVVVVDERGGGNGRCLPAGPLRQPVPDRLPAHTLLVYTAARASLPLHGHLAPRRPGGVQSLGDWQRDLPLPADGGWAALDGKEVHAAAGVAVPQRFFAMLRSQGLRIIAEHALPDHARWASPPWPPDASDAVVTEKDAIKLSSASGGTTRIWVVKLDLSLPEALLSSIDAALSAFKHKAHG